MSTENAYQCEQCQKEKLVKSGETPPECCGATMQSIPLDQCTLTSTAEHSRADMFDEPCDDGREG
jgi:hypothetical protein